MTFIYCVNNNPNILLNVLISRYVPQLYESLKVNIFKNISNIPEDFSKVLICQNDKIIITDNISEELILAFAKFIKHLESVRNEYISEEYVSKFNDVLLMILNSMMEIISRSFATGALSQENSLIFKVIVGIVYRINKLVIDKIGQNNKKINSLESQIDLINKLLAQLFKSNSESENYIESSNITSESGVTNCSELDQSKIYKQVTNLLNNNLAKKQNINDISYLSSRSQNILDKSSKIVFDI